ncbi:hypothetical protein Phum_PHUM063480 [Pediculus humanus corporis]|uniref:VWFC domain-containing protein n=1 Tax=Pediculus humanus subsp. corporis TaxID=121224 RepID=E0VBK6_PEDHC|nr:uncharacterized protein Phum_PHUM063480 [Pediculus humanus corporis]EEB10762.1 hypothetical protein Phum_PHUM063480 [Pediculus humanus corporis]
MIFFILFSYFGLMVTFQLPTGSLGSTLTCIHGGIKYKEGDYFPQNKTFIKPENPLQCVQCRCHQGLVVCEVENCLNLNCNKPKKYSRFCCLQCPGEGQTNVYEERSDFTFDQNNNNEDEDDDDDDYVKKRKKNIDCNINDEHYVNGSIWQPVIGPFGIMACVQCECKEGNVVCGRIKCNHQPCSNPVKEFGECCPVCPKTTENNYGKENEFYDLFIWKILPENSLNNFKKKKINKEKFNKLNFQLFGSGKCFVQCYKKIKRLEKLLGIFSVVYKSKCDDKNEFDISNI